jgi:REP element-mobilizing transposase RayT
MDSNEKAGRRSIRLRDYDYSQAGAYFVTICTHKRIFMFGDIQESKMCINDYGRKVQGVWAELPNHYGNVILDEFAIMPNHIHGIIMLADTVGAGLKPAPTKKHGLPEIVRALKTFSSRLINQARNVKGIPVWQRNYYEHVIRDENSLNRTREYITTNPARWHLDRENPDRTGEDGFDLWLATFQTRPETQYMEKEH